MDSPSDVPHIVRFDQFEVDLRSGELSNRGSKLRLQDKPLQVLTLLLEHVGQVVDREELEKRLWPDGVVVDFEHSINSAVKRLRQTLGDEAGHPRYIETLPRHGYRFIAPIEVPHPAPSPERRGLGDASRKSLVRSWLAGGIVVMALAVLVALNFGRVRDWFATGVRARHAVSVPRIESIAVLPLENLSHDPEQEYFADGMTEELITDLGKISALRVISRTSVMRYKGTKKPLPEIARELNVDAIVEGTVLCSGDRVRVTANLLDAPRDRHLWAQTYERGLGDALGLQDEVAEDIAHKVEVKLQPLERARFAPTRAVNPEAYELYLKGRYQENRVSNEGLRKSLVYFQKVIHLDPGFAPAYSGIADSYLTLGIDGFDSGAVVFPKARAAALQALQIDASSAEAHASMGFTLFTYAHDYGAGIKELETATRLNPNYVKARLWYTLTLAWLGRTEEAVRELEQALKLDPLSARIDTNLVYVFYLGRQYDRAIAEGRKALQVEPNNAWTYGFLGRAYFQNGMPQEAFVAFERRLALQPNFPKAEADMAVAYAAIGNRQEALKILGQLRRHSNHEYVTAYPIARAYVALGQKEEALTSLRKGREVNDGDMIQLYVDPALDPLRSDPRFQELVRHMHFPQ